VTRFIDRAIENAGLGDVVQARRDGDLSRARLAVEVAGTIDLLVLGALADSVRALENGDVVRVHETADGAVRWVRALEAEPPSELELLRLVALARITGEIGAAIGVDWGRHGLELAQVALGFGATDLTGPITRKSGLVILDDDKRRVKGEGMVAASALKRREIAALVRNAGRTCEFVERPSVSGVSAAEVVHA
jgi:hypothetical protein